MGVPPAGQRITPPGGRPATDPMTALLGKSAAAMRTPAGIRTCPAMQGRVPPAASIKATYKSAILSHRSAQPVRHAARTPSATRPKFPEVGNDSPSEERDLAIASTGWHAHRQTSRTKPEWPLDEVDAGGGYLMKFTSSIQSSKSLAVAFPLTYVEFTWIAIAVRCWTSSLSASV